jgi:hypothetical protein
LAPGEKRIVSLSLRAPSSPTSIPLTSAATAICASTVSDAASIQVVKGSM